MPIYEYHCDACNTVFEEWRRHADDVMEEPCPKCRKTAHRLISNTTFVLKGGGWYVTEYGGRKPESPVNASEGTATNATPSTSTTEAPAVSTPTPVASTPAPTPAAAAD